MRVAMLMEDTDTDDSDGTADADDTITATGWEIRNAQPGSRASLKRPFSMVSQPSARHDAASDAGDARGDALPRPPGRLASSAARLALRSALCGGGAAAASPCAAPLLAALLASRAAPSAAAHPAGRDALEAAAGGGGAVWDPDMRVLCAHLLATAGAAAAPALRRLAWAVSPDARAWRAWCDGCGGGEGGGSVPPAATATTAAAAATCGEGGGTVPAAAAASAAAAATEAAAAAATAAVAASAGLEQEAAAAAAAATADTSAPPLALRESAPQELVPVAVQLADARGEKIVSGAKRRRHGDVAVRRVALRALLRAGGAPPGGLRALAGAGAAAASAAGAVANGASGDVKRLCSTSDPASDAFVTLLLFGGLSDSVVEAPAVLDSNGAAVDDALLCALSRAVAAPPCDTPARHGLPRAVARARLARAAWAHCARPSFASALASSPEVLAALVGLAEARAEAGAPPLPARRSLELMGGEGDRASNDADAEALENQLASGHARAALVRLLRVAPPRDGGGGGGWGAALGARALLAAATPASLAPGSRDLRRLDGAAASLLRGGDESALALAHALEEALRSLHAGQCPDSVAFAAWLARALLRRPRRGDPAGPDPVLAAARAACDAVRRRRCNRRGGAPVHCACR